MPPATAVPLFLDEATVLLGFDTPVGGATVTAVAATDVFTTASAHGLAIGDRIIFLTVTGAAPIAVGTTYYVLTVPSGTTFTLSLTSGGAVLDITTAGTAGTIAKMVDYACHLSAVSLDVKPGKVVTFTPLCPDGAVSEVGADEFTLEFTGAQDWAVGGLARLLWDNAGELVRFVINAYGVANTASTPGVAGVVRSVRPAYGGKADEYAPLEVSLPVVGVPTLAVA